MDIRSFIAKFPDSEHYNQEVLFTPITQEIVGVNSEPFAGVHLFLFVFHGDLLVRVNGVDYLLNQGGLADIINQSELQLLNISGNFSGFLLAMDVTYFREVVTAIPPFPITYPLERKLNPIIRIRQEEMQVLLNILSRISAHLKDVNHLYLKEVLHKEMCIFMMEMGNIVLQMHDMLPDYEAIDRKRMLIMKFVGLLTKHIRTEHNIDFYASKLCISKQYLGRILREETNLTAHDFIARILVAESEKLLRKKDLTIQVVADTLGFSDQAAFSKFFKKHAGVPPLKFRSSLHLKR
jgi:AraC-type DNA-binding domain-containing proteins